MSKLLERLRDASRSGVYRAATAHAIVDATRGSALDVQTIDAANDPLDAIARVLRFPAWYGRNWDALEDLLADLSWRPGRERVLVFAAYPGGRDLDRLLDVLRSAAAHWAGRGVPFFAVMIDPAKKLPLPELYRGA